VPNELQAGQRAFWVWVAIILLGSCTAFHPMTPGIGIGIFLWWLGTCLYYFVLKPNSELQRLKKQSAEVEITAKKHPRLQALLAKGSTLLGIARPAGFLLDESDTRMRIQGRSHPYYLTVTKGAVDLMQPPELDCLALRSLVQARQGHVRRIMMMDSLTELPGISRVLVWPAILYGFLLRMWWRDLAEKTADRLTLLLVKNPKLLTGALLKIYAMTDPLLQDRKITAVDVDNFIRQSGAIGTSGLEISTQYKLGQAIHDYPVLEERLQSLNRWAASPDFKTAVDRLAETRSTAAPAAPSTATPSGRR